MKKAITTLLSLVLLTSAVACEMPSDCDTSDSCVDTIVAMDETGDETEETDDGSMEGMSQGSETGDDQNSMEGQGWGSETGNTPPEDGEGWCDFTADANARYFHAENGDVCARVDLEWNGETYDVTNAEFRTPETGYVSNTLDCQWQDYNDGKAWTGFVQCFFDGVDGRMILVDLDASNSSETNSTNDRLNLAGVNSAGGYDNYVTYILEGFNG